MKCLPHIFAVLLSGTLLLKGAQPSWWSTGTTAFIDASASGTNNYSPANLGQLKNVARRAALLLNANLPGGAGSTVNTLVNSFTPLVGGTYTSGTLAALIAANYSPINLGQLKSVAKPFYDRLLDAGYDTKANLIARGYSGTWAYDYPWNPSTPVSQNYAPANLGQLKMVFSFDILLDTDTNSIPDWWEQHYFSGLLGASGTADFDHDGLTNAQEYTQGSDPTNYFSQGTANIIPVLSISGGNNQVGATGQYLSEPLSIEIRSGTGGTLLIHAPLTFSISGSYGQISATGTGGLSSTQSVASGSDGVASVYLVPSGSNGTVNHVLATATSGTNTVSLTFTATTSAMMQVAGGGNYQGTFSLGLKSDGSVWAWGSNSSGQLGNGTTQDSVVPVQVSGLSNVTQIAAGDSYGLALKSDGSVWAWGNNSFGALGNGTTTGTSSPGQVSDLSNVTAITAGAFHAMALKSDGSVWAWGSNSNGQLGSGTTSDSSVPVQVNSLSGVASISAGLTHSLAVTTSGTVWAWGADSNGQLGSGTSDSNVPVSVSGLSGVTAVAAGDSYSVALKSDGTIMTWGANWAGQLGNSGTADSATPVSVSSLTGIVKIAAGNGTTLAVDSSGNVWGWGYNSDSELGNGTIVSSATAALISGSSAPLSISAGGYHSLALSSGGVVSAWGDNSSGQLGTQPAVPTRLPVPIPNLNGLSSVAAGTAHSAAVTGSGTIWAWGSNSNGQLGDGTNIDRSSPVTLAGFSGTATAISSGAYHTLALKADGSVWAWGDNSKGQLGSGTASSGADSPVEVSGWSGTATAISAGSYHSLALKSDGTVWAWGDNSTNQLGSGTEAFSGTAAEVTSLSGTITAISAGAYHSLAIKSDGSVEAWGANWYGQLGDSGTETVSGTGVTVAGFTGTATAVSAGSYHSLALKSDGSVWAWGYNGEGELGNGTTVDSGTAMPVVGLSGTATAIAAGPGYSLAVLSDGSLWAWGDNSSGQFGNGSTQGSNLPVQVPGLYGVSKVYAGQGFVVAVKSDGSAVAWGDNSSGQIGVGTNGRQVTAPQTVLGLNLSSGAVPAASLSAPTNGTMVATGTSITLTASATAGSGTLSKVEFYQEGVKIGEDTSSPYQMTWSATTWGNFDFSVIATDSTNTKSAQSSLTQVGVIVDSDHNGLPDWWETKYFGGTGTSASALSPSGDGLTNLQNYQQGINPNDYYNGSLPALQIVSGNNQSGVAGTALPNPLVVKLADSNGNILSHAPISFSVSGTHGQVAASGTGSLASGQNVATGTDGLASVWLTPSGSNGVANIVVATATSGTQTVSGTFTATTLVTVTGTSSSNLQLVSGGWSSGGFSVGAKADGTVWDWGNNSSGQLGDGTTTSTDTPNQVPFLTGIKAVSAGDKFAVGLDGYGRVWAWGNNGSGQLGNGTTTSNPAPALVPGISNILSIAAGDSHVVAVDTSGTVWAWGNNRGGQLGDGTNLVNQSTPVEAVGLSGITAVAAGSDYSLALKNDGSVWGWGNGYGGPTVEPVEIDGFSGTIAAISAAPDGNALAVATSGTVWAWSGTDNAPAAKSGLAGIVSVSAGTGGAGLAIDTSGSIWTWASGTDTPVALAGISNATAVSPNSDYGLALTSSGKVYGWGDSFSIGNGTPEDTDTVMQIPNMNGIVAASAGGAHSLAVKSDGTVWAWGANDSGQLGSGTTDSSLLPIQVSGSLTAIAVAAGASHSLAIHSTGTAGTVWAWGANDSGQLGDGSTTMRASPVQSGTFTDVIALAAGSSHSLALRADHTVWAWGYNGDGELGAGTTDSGTTSPVQAVGLSSIVQIAAGSGHSLALDSSGTVHAWGANQVGQLGNGTTTGTNSAISISGVSSVTAIAAGQNHSLALKSDGSVWAWGKNDSGQLGNGTTVTGTLPAQVTGLGEVAAIGAGGDTSFAIKSDGTLWVWGDNSSGQFGNQTVVGSKVPVQVPWFAGASKIFAGSNFALALKQDQTLAAWGDNSSGQVGINVDSDDPQVPPQVVQGLDLGSGTAPSLSFSSPLDGTFIATGTTVPLVANVVAGSGTVSKVEFYQEGVKIGEADSSPYQLTWSATTAGDFHFSALATNGAGLPSKRAFSTERVIVDGGHNGLPDWWENEFLSGTSGHTASSAAPNAGGLTLLQSYVAWINLYNGVLPKVAIVGGDGQVGPANVMLQTPLTVQVTDGNGQPVINAPVLFSAASGTGEFALTGTGSLATTETVSTGTTGMASVYLEPSGTTSGTTTNLILASVTSGSLAASGTFTELASPIGSPSVPDAPNVTATIDPSYTSVDLNWDPSSGATGYTIEVSNDGGKTWSTSGTVSGTTTNFIVSGLIAGTSHTFAVTASNPGGNSPKGGTNGPNGPGSGGPGGGSNASLPSLDLDPPPTYAVINLDSSGHFAPVKITNSGKILMQGSGAVWNSGTTTTLNPPPGAHLDSVADINEAGTVIGTVSVPHAITYPPYEYEDNYYGPFQDGGYVKLFTTESRAAVWPLGSSSPTSLISSIFSHSPTSLSFDQDTELLVYTQIISDAVGVAISNSGALRTRQLVSLATDNYDDNEGIKTAEGIFDDFLDGSQIGDIRFEVLPDSGHGGDGVFDKGEGTAQYLIDHNDSDDQIYTSYTYHDYTQVTKYDYNGTQLSFRPTKISNRDLNGVVRIIGSGTDGSGPVLSEDGSIVTVPNASPFTGISSGTITVDGTSQPDIQLTGGSVIWKKNPATGDWDGPFNVAKMTPGLKNVSISGINDENVIIGMATGTDGSTYAAAFPHVELGVDANRDGTIVLANETSGTANAGKPIDVTSQDKPYRFWINNDQDQDDVQNPDWVTPGASSEEEVVPPQIPDFESHKIRSKRNLEDFSRLWLYVKGFSAAITAGDIQVGLKWTNVSGGSPGINVYQAVEEDDGGSDYLTDQSTAAAQIAGDYNDAIADVNGKQTVDTSGTFIFPKDFFTGLDDNDPKEYLLFEGASKGKGELVIVFLDKSGNEIGEGPGVWMDLRNIKEMYQRAIAGPQPQKPYDSESSQPVSNIGYTMDTSHGVFVPDPNEDKTNPTYVVFVHGFNQITEQSFNYAETMFKRFWQRGYKGRLAVFRWPTYGNGTVPWGAIGTYNDSEYVAWCSGDALKQFVGTLSQSGYAVDIVAHSMGNIVTGKALHDGMSAAHYALLHAASSASCYSNGGSSYPVTSSNTVVPDNDSDSATKVLGYTAYLGSISAGGGIVNFYDTNDEVTGSIWDLNNNHFKPQGLALTFYDYESTQPSRQKLFLGANSFLTGKPEPIRFVTSPDEAKAYVDHSLTGAVGHNSAKAGSITDIVPEDVFGNSHSYEWDNGLQDVNTLNFYNTLMDKMRLQRITP